MKTPLLFLIFNRPDLTARTFEVIRAAKPRQLFIAADGPRARKAGEAELCAQTRAVVEKVDWPCEVQTLFRAENLGCKRSVSGAITWFFEHVSEGIILEDDCLPDPSFFQYCSALLEKFRDDPEVVSIGGNNFQPPSSWNDHGYYFSNYGHIWGWATWRRAWANYQIDLRDWPRLKPTSWLKNRLRGRAACVFWEDIFDRCAAGEIDTWDYQWTFSSWLAGGKSIVPGTNLVENIGFDSRATHTTGQPDWMARLSQKPLRFPLKPWLGDKINWAADRYTNEHIFGVHQPTMGGQLKNAALKPVRKFKGLLRGLVSPASPKESH